MANNGNGSNASYPDRVYGWNEVGKKVLSPDPPKSKPNVKAPPPPPTPKVR